MSLSGAIAVTRFGLGARPGEIETASADPQAWLLGQLTEAAGTPPGFSALPGSKEKATEQQVYFQARQRNRNGELEFTEEEIENFTRSLRRTLIAESQARIAFGATTAAPFHERLTRFWFNHFSVSGLKFQAAPLVGAYEREAIRPNILGRFTDLAAAAIFHPAMLIYLDNQQSVGPNSMAGRRRDLGLNENLAREVMELHTVTPAAGYSQGDVTEFARALTGWTIGNERLSSGSKIGETVFARLIHEPGARTVLGKRYSDAGEEQAKKIISDLCLHPATARNVAFKLARHFTADDPPETLVAKLETSFLNTGGDLKALYSVLVEAPECWMAEAEKVKTPDELITSTARLVGIRQAFAGDARGVLEGLAQAPFTAPSPEGWPDEAEAWLGPDAILKRIEWANRLAERSPDLDARNLLLTGLGSRVSAETIEAVARAESPKQGLVLAMMSPDFQRR